MKRFFLFILSIPWFITANAQSIVACEYWMDGDMDNITEVAVSGSEATFAINVSGLTDGMHTLYYRVRDDQGRYSVPCTWLYMKDTALRGSNGSGAPSSIVTCEYWMDGDMSNITEISVDSTQVAFAINVSGLADGMHTLYYRVKDDKGSYSAPSTWLYMKDTALRGSNGSDAPSSIVTCEYWMDGDMENITEISVDSTQVAFAINVSGLADGMHTLYYRVKDDKGSYSAPSTWLYMKDTALRGSNGSDAPSSIVTCEYWMDGDMENITEISVDSTQVAFAINVSGLADGMHTLYYRVKDDKGSYSAPSTWLYMKDSALRANSGEPRITWYKFWWNHHQDKAERVEVECDTSEFILMRKLDIPDYVKTDGDTCFTSGKLMFLFGNNKGYSSAVDTAEVTFPLNRYMLTYMVDSAEYMAESIEFGDTLTLTAEPTKEGHSFSGWSKIPLTMPARDVTVTGTFIPNRYRVTYWVNDAIYHIDSIAYGTELVAIAEPTKEGHTFGGWSTMPETMPAGDVEVTGEFIVNSTQTDWQGLTYALNEAGTAFEITGYTDSLVADVAIPDVLCELPVTSIQERALMDAEVLESIVVPSSVTNVGKYTFIGCDNLLIVEWNATAPLESSFFEAAGDNGNMLVFTAAAAMSGDAELYSGNVVVDGVAEEITLTDGKVFRNPREFTARRITYSREFTKETRRGVSGGWEAMVLPFDVQQIMNEEKSVITPISPAGSTDGLLCWVATWKQGEGSFVLDTHIKANVPFIMEVPNCDEYEEYFNIRGMVSFSATDAKVYATVEDERSENSGYNFVGTYDVVASDSHVYALNDDEYDAGEGEAYMPGGVFVAGLRDIRPFEAYMLNTDVTRAFYLPVNRGDTGIGAVLSVKDENWYTLQGIRLSERPHEKGLYIHGGKVVVVK